MSQPQWTTVDSYFAKQLVEHDPALEAALESSAEAGLPPISVSPSQGKLLYLLARLQGARRILEIGTLGGYSTIWLARALPEDGRLVTLEAVAKHAEVAEVNIARAGLADIVEIRLGPALETLPKLAEESRGPFDLTFTAPHTARRVVGGGRGDALTGGQVPAGAGGRRDAAPVGWGIGRLRGGAPEVSLEDGSSRTVDWYRAQERSHAGRNR